MVCVAWWYPREPSAEGGAFKIRAALLCCSVDQTHGALSPPARRCPGGAPCRAPVTPTAGRGPGWRWGLLGYSAALERR